MVGGVAISYANIIAMLVLNVAPFAYFLCAVNVSLLNNQNTHNSYVNLRKIKKSYLLLERLATYLVTIRTSAKIN